MRKVIMEEYEIRIKEAIQLLINAVNKGQAHGAYTLEESSKIWDAINTIIAPNPIVEPTDKEKSPKP